MYEHMIQLLYNPIWNASKASERLETNIQNCDVNPSSGLTLTLESIQCGFSLVITESGSLQPVHVSSIDR